MEMAYTFRGIIRSEIIGLMKFNKSDSKRWADQIWNPSKKKIYILRHEIKDKKYASSM